MKKNIPNPKEITKTTWAPGFRRYPSKQGNTGIDNTDPFDDFIEPGLVANAKKTTMHAAKSMHTNGANSGNANLNPDEDRPE